MIIKYRIHEKFNEHYGCNCCEGGYDKFYNTIDEVVESDICCAGMELLKLQCDIMLDDSDGKVSYGIFKRKFEHVEDDYENYLYSFRYCPSCGTEIVLECTSHIKDIVEFVTSKKKKRVCISEAVYEEREVEHTKGKVIGRENLK